MDEATDWWGSFTSWGGDMVESVGEGANAWVGAFTTNEINKLTASADPTEAAKTEPVKGKDSDGTTIVQPQQSQPQQLTLSKDDLLMYGGIAIAVFALVLAVKG